MQISVAFSFAVLLGLSVLPIQAQVRKLHTRDLTRLSQVQIADYLKRSDVVFIPVGAVESNEILPSDRNYVQPLGMAIAMADELDAVYMPGLIWSYPGTSVVASAGIRMTPTEGTAFLRTLAESLLKQGFRRQIYVSMGHGPAALTIGTLVREFYDERHVPILYINMDTYLPRLNLKPEQRSKLTFGAYHLAGRVEDIPVQGDYGPAESAPAGAVPTDPGLQTLSRLGLTGSLAVGTWLPDVMAHPSGREASLPANASEREAWGREGRAQIVGIVQRMQLRDAVQALSEHDDFTKQVLVPKFGSVLPGVQ
jgi:creatinine amidohydrolase